MKKLFFIIFILALLFFPLFMVFAVESVSLENPMGSRTNIVDILGDIIAGVMGIVGSLTLLAFVVGGFLWLTAAGNAEQVKKGTQTMLWAAVGVFIIFSSYAILNLVLQGITGK